MMATLVFAASPSPEQIQIGDQVEDLTQQANIEVQKNTLPITSTINIVLSIAEDANFQPKHLVLMLDGKEVAQITYGKKERNAFALGGYQSLLLKKLASGAHQVSATIDGETSRNKPLQYNADLRFSGTGKTLLLQVNKASDKIPAFIIKEWSVQ